MTRKCSDLLVAKDRAGLDVSGATTDLLADCLDTLSVNDADSVEIEDTLWLKIAVVVWDATKNDKRTWLDFQRIEKTVCAELLQYFLAQNATLIYACNSIQILTCKMSKMCYREHNIRSSCIGCSDGLDVEEWRRAGCMECTTC